MSTVRIAGIAAAAVFVGAGAFAQSTDETSSTKTAAASADNTTVVGCLMKETDYRSAHGLGSGAFGGAGLGDEYVIVDAMVMPQASASATPTNASTSAAPANSSSNAAACSESSGGEVYRLTGPRERDMAPMLGHRVEVTGKLRHADEVNAGKTNSKLPPEIRIDSFSAAPPTAATEQASTTTTETSAAPPTTAAESAAPEPPASVEAQNNTAAQPVGTSGRLPRTAGEEPLIRLIGLMFIGAGISLKLLRRATA